jgi:branched-chain amino acid transport system ATP-binding protein
MGAMPQAVLKIEAEHRSIAAVLHCLEHLVRAIGSGASEPDFELLSVILDYIDVFAERFHHPKEDRYLFTLLRDRTAEAHAVIEDLVAEHAQGDRLIHDLRHALALYRVTGPEGFVPFAAAVDRYLAFHWNHMRKEEDIILPLASRVLTDADWRTIDEAFGENDDPMFGAKPRHAFQKLFQLIVRLAPPPLGVGPTRPEPP